MGAKTRVHLITIRDVFFADDAAVTSHIVQELQALMNSISQTCKDSGLSNSQKKTTVLARGMQTPPVTTIDNYEPGVV